MGLQDPPATGNRYAMALTMVSTDTAKHPSLSGARRSHKVPPITHSNAKRKSAKDRTKMGSTCNTRWYGITASVDAAQDD